MKTIIEKAEDLNREKDGNNPRLFRTKHPYIDGRHETHLYLNMDLVAELAALFTKEKE